MLSRYQHSLYQMRLHTREDRGVYDNNKGKKEKKKDLSIMMMTEVT